jgi:Holliday junction DNA helicase RuvA
MIRRIAGKIVERRPYGLIVQVDGIGYEVLVPTGVLRAIEETGDGAIELVTYYYFQLDPAKAVPVLVGFRNELEREFFEHFIQVASIGPRSAVKALALPIAQIAEAIEAGDTAILKTLPGIGAQKAKEIVAKLQGKAGRFCLIQGGERAAEPVAEDISREAIGILTSVGHTTAEAREMVRRAVAHKPQPETVEDLLNLAYRLRKRAGG